MILLLIGGAVFAQSGTSEPVFTESAEYVQDKSPVSGFWFPGIHDTIYLWAFNPADSSEFVDFAPLVTLAAAADTDVPQVIPGNIRNNKFYLESIRLTRLAQESYDYGDYDKSTEYAAQALLYAQQSDEYVALQLKIKETNDVIAAARSRFDWAASVGAASRYPGEYSQAQIAYNEALSFRSAEEWDRAIAAAHRVIDLLANVTAAAPSVTVPLPDGTLPARYTVRTWQIERDCFWNIAGRPWAYGDPTKWRLLYEANKTKLPEPNNPDLIEPGMILDIPSLKGEARQGLWEPGRTYNPLR
ncbi:MAG: LysM peptidoglycan-binding domain-containing protein [Treponema sp.]|nr:LysM peptidoglycan-binding domain-containing protein [Treponema sp.]